MLTIHLSVFLVLQKRRRGLGLLESIMPQTYIGTKQQQLVQLLTRIFTDGLGDFFFYENEFKRESNERRKTICVTLF